MQNWIGSRHYGTLALDRFNCGDACVAVLKDQRAKSSGSPVLGEWWATLGSPLINTVGHTLRVRKAQRVAVAKLSRNVSAPRASILPGLASSSTTYTSCSDTSWPSTSTATAADHASPTQFASQLRTWAGVCTDPGGDDAGQVVVPIVYAIRDARHDVGNILGAGKAHSECR